MRALSTDPNMVRKREWKKAKREGTLEQWHIERAAFKAAERQARLAVRQQANNERKARMAARKIAAQEQREAAERARQQIVKPRAIVVHRDPTCFTREEIMRARGYAMEGSR